MNKKIFDFVCDRMHFVQQDLPIYQPIIIAHSGIYQIYDPCFMKAYCISKKDFWKLLNDNADKYYIKKEGV